MKKIKFNFFKFSGGSKAKDKKEKEAKPKVKKPPKPKEPRIPTEFEKYYFHRFSDRKEYKKRRQKFAKEVAPLLIDGCGGIKNISGVKLLNYMVKIQFKNMYQLKEDILKKTGGLHLKIEDHEVTDIFDFTEAKNIVALIKKEIKANKNKFIKLDLA